MSCSRQSASPSVDPSVALQLGEVTITPSAHIRYLGIVLDEHLSFGEHVRQLERKVGSKLAMFRKVRDHMTVTAKRAFYICSIQTVLEYGRNSFAHCLSVTLHDRLVRLSNRALRIVFSMPRSSDVSLINARHHILPLSVRYQFKLYILVFRVLNQLKLQVLLSLLIAFAFVLLLLVPIPALALRYLHLSLYHKLKLVSVSFQFLLSVPTVGMHSPLQSAYALHCTYSVIQYFHF